MRGIIFDIQHFCVHDGPGIRTVVFLKGCSLRCAWCCNPESQNLAPELMFDVERCINCKRCAFCNVIKFGESISLERDLCNVCGICEECCPTNALRIVGKYVEANEVIEEVLKDSVFHRKGGGVTFSGGEPFMQPEFLMELLKLSKKESIDVAIETSGFAKWEKIEKAIRHVDHFLFDIKAVDEKKHVQLTGARNDLILENLKRVSREAEVVLRCVIVEGYNFESEAEALKLAEICKSVGVERIDLLKYHRFGEKKYRMLGRSYGLKVSETGLIHRFQDILKKEGFKVSVGGLI
ncbi:MAG: glycyl-radical enzyme activating protein [Archaeoglobaceae archaeon]